MRNTAVPAFPDSPVLPDSGRTGWCKSASAAAGSAEWAAAASGSVVWALAALEAAASAAVVPARAALSRSPPTSRRPRANCRCCYVRGSSSRRRSPVARATDQNRHWPAAGCRAAPAPERRAQVHGVVRVELALAPAKTAAVSPAERTATPLSAEATTRTAEAARPALVGIAAVRLAPVNTAPVDIAAATMEAVQTETATIAVRRPTIARRRLAGFHYPAC